MNNLNQYKLLKRVWLPFIMLLSLLTFSFQAEAQENPPRPIIVTQGVIVEILQQLNFGSIIPGIDSGGTVTVDSYGGRTCIGNIFLLGSNFSRALFLVDAEPGTLIKINYNSNNPTIHLNNGGYHLTLNLEMPSTGFQFIPIGQYTDVYIGGTLTVGSIGANPAGNYTGTFQVTFIQE